jgi:myo-inositol-1(or 4)-monophosphatase
MNDDSLLVLLHETADAVAAALRTVSDWGPSGRRDGQYVADLVVDDAALSVLRAAGVGVLSEESGVENDGRNIVVILDPLDGSTNASQGIPWFATSLCALDADGPRAALVVNQAGSGGRYSAVRGGGAALDGRPLRGGSGCRQVGDAIVGLSGLPPRHLGWRQYRTLGAAALDLCLVAEGVLDGFVDCSPDAHGVWDYAGAWLICREAGVAIGDAFDRDLIVRSHSERRTPVAAASDELYEELLGIRRSW